MPFVSRVGHCLLWPCDSRIIALKHQVSQELYALVEASPDDLHSLALLSLQLQDKRLVLVVLPVA